MVPIWSSYFPLAHSLDVGAPGRVRAWPCTSATEADPKELISGGSMLIILAAGQQDLPGRTMKVADLEIPQSDLYIALISFSFYVLKQLLWASGRHLCLWGTTEEKVSGMKHGPYYCVWFWS